MGLRQWLQDWFGRPPEPTAARVPQAGGAFGQQDAVFDAQGAVLLHNDVSGMGGTLLWQVGAEVTYNPKDGPQTIKIALYRDEHLLIESLPYEVTAGRPTLTVSLGTADKIGIGRYRYSLRAEVVRGSWARVAHRWMIWIERRP
ncbi:MAG: hypothetical protein M1376_15585 [Planctomycetes bacterium]|nr:hypothetical protein [Planctomycetota bacterium]